MLEWYDFAIYAFFATTIARQFFPAGDDTVALLSTFLVFGSGFIVRPLGGLIIGSFGDRHGRKPALVLTITLMAIGTGLIGIIPSYSAIGTAATVLLIVARLLQGFSAGGEWGGSAVFVVEWAPPGRRGFFGGLHETTAVIGPLIASGVAAFLATVLSGNGADEWGWRIAFLLGGLIGPVGIYLRRNVGETPAYEQRATRTRSTKTVSRPVLLAVQAFCMVALIYASFYTLFFLSTYTQRYVGLSPKAALWATTIATFALAITVPIAATLSDRFGRKPLMLAGCVLFALFGYPLFTFMGKDAPLSQIVLLEVLFAFFTGLFAGPFPAAITEQFPTKFRLAGLSVAYNLAGILFGGFNSYISTWLIERTGSPLAVSYIVIVAAVLSGLAMLSVRETAHEPLI